MAEYLIDRPPRVRQWYDKRNRPLTGLTVLHTAESVMDSIGPDTGAENVAAFIAGRTTPGSYHDLVDSDSWVKVVPYRHGAFHDGTGSNNFALSLSFACRTTDWRTMPAVKRAGFMRQGARAFLEQQAYRRSIGAPLTPLKLISKAASDRGESGFTYHGWRDPGRRSDPGTVAPNVFPFDELVRAILTELGDNEGDLDMASAQSIEDKLDGYGRRIERIDSGDHGGWGYGARIEAMEKIVVALAEQAGIDVAAVLAD